MTAEQLGQIAAAPAEAPPGRKSFQDGVADLLASSRLKAIADGTAAPETWPLALNADCLAATTFFAKFADDLTRITGRTAHGVPFHVGQFSPIAANPFPDTKTRAVALWERFQVMFGRRADAAIRDIGGKAVKVLHDDVLSVTRTGRREVVRYNRSVYPLFPVKHQGDLATFTALSTGAGGEKLYAVALATHRYVDPGDHVMRVPASVQAKLAVLRTTHFEYHPKVLTGTQVAKQEVVFEEERRYSQYDPDPALCIHFGLAYPPFVAEFWEEPLSANEPKPVVLPRMTPYLAWAGAFSLIGAFLFVVAVRGLIDGYFVLPAVQTVFGALMFFLAWCRLSGYRTAVDAAWKTVGTVPRHDLHL